ncbi:MAG: hypothetical protein BGO98_34640 [Myxococcales bacterium 68-20]|nr:MAG: hypothetical protein BGO98_34640 [Myxococcales bacterium 68-20]
MASFRPQLQSFAAVPAFGVCVAALLFCPRALADSTFALTWDAGTKRSCITESALRAAVEQKIGRPLGDVEHADIVIEGRETKRAVDHVSAEVAQRTHDGKRLGSRTIHARDCRGLHEAATLVVALIVQADQEEISIEQAPTRTEHTEHAELAEHADKTQTAAPVALSPTAPRVAHPPSSPGTPPSKATGHKAPRSKGARFELSLGPGVEASTGILPSVAGLLGVHARLKRTSSPWSFDWMGGYALPQTLHRGATVGEFSALEQRIRVCAAPYERRAFAFELCGGALWAVVIPNTTGSLAGHHAWSSTGAPLVSLGADLSEGAAALRLEASAALPFRRYSFTYRDAERGLSSFYTTAPAFFFLGLSGRLTIF